MSTSFKDLLSQNSTKALMKARETLASKKKQKDQKKINRGDIFYIKADQKNGITPKDGGLYWPKHFIALGQLADGRLCCCAVFDSQINRDYVHPDYHEFFLPVKASEYIFLTHDSYIDCLEMKSATPEKLLGGKHEGSLTEDHLKKVLELVKLSPKHDHIKLSLFGLNK